MTQNTSDDGLPNTIRQQEGTGQLVAVRVNRRHPAPSVAQEVVRDLYVADGLDRMDPRTRERVVRAILDRFGLD